MPLKIIRQDILMVKADAIVNPTNEFFEPGGGIDYALHKSAGPRLQAACKKLGYLDIGSAKITAGFDLKAKYVIHTAGPWWRGGNYGEIEALESCYRESLILARDFGCKSVAFPLISSGTYEFPKDKVLKIAIKVINEFLYSNELLVYLVVYDKSSYETSKSLKLEILSYIDDNFSQRDIPKYYNANMNHSLFINELPCCSIRACSDVSLPDMIENMDKGFSETLLSIIDAKGLNDVDTYKKANASKQTWHKLISNPDWKPSKNTAIAFCIALELDLEETQNLLAKAGYTLSNATTFDVVIRFFIQRKKYDVMLINETLFDMDLPLL